MTQEKAKKILKILLPSILLIFILGLVYVPKVNENLIKDCNASIENFLSPTWGPNPQGADVKDEIICKHNLWHNLNPFR